MSSKKNNNKIENKVNVDIENINESKIYLGFNVRFFLLFILFIIFSVISCLLMMMSFSIINEKRIDYQEKSNIDYRVYLKENEFYDEEYLEKDMVYVSSLIQKIETDFEYNFSITDNSNINFDYDIIGKLLITDVNNSKIFFEKDYVLLDGKSKQINDGRDINIKETIKINYGYYNDLANRYRQQYGVNSQSYFIVNMNVNKISLDDVLKLNNNSVMSVKIPLSQNEVNIRIDSNELNNNSNVVSESVFKITNIINIVFSILTGIIAIILFRYVFALIPRSSKYDKFLGKILKEYDRFIVETTTPPDDKNLKVVKVHKFVELLDVRDNLSQPIKYYSITEHQKGVFYINYGEEIYIYMLKAVDVE